MSNPTKQEKTREVSPVWLYLLTPLFWVVDHFAIGERGDE